MHMTFASPDFQTTCYLHLIYKCWGQLCQVSESRDVRSWIFLSIFSSFLTLWSSHYQSMVASQYKECLIHPYIVRVGNKWIDSLVIRNLIFIAHLSDTSLVSLARTSPGLQNLWLLVKIQSCWIFKQQDKPVLPQHANRFRSAFDNHSPSLRQLHF